MHIALRQMAMKVKIFVAKSYRLFTIKGFSNAGDRESAILAFRFALDFVVGFLIA